MRVSGRSGAKGRECKDCYSVLTDYGNDRWGSGVAGGIVGLHLYRADGEQPDQLRKFNGIEASL